MPDHPPHPGRILLERFLEPLSITPAALARGLRMPVRQVTDVLAGRRKINVEMALRLGFFFDAPPHWWLDMQTRFDTATSRRTQALRKAVKPYAKLDRVLVTPEGARLLSSTSRPRGETEMQRIPADMLARLRKQAALAPPRRKRRAVQVRYEDGTVALVGRAD